MTDHGETATPGVERGDGRTTARTFPAVRDRRDVQDCGCLDCRNIAATSLRRSVLDTVVWSVRLLRTRPSILGLALGLFAAGRFADVVLPRHLPVPAVELFELIVLFGLLVLLRAYVAGIAAADLTGRRLSLPHGLWNSLRRMPALVGVVVGIAVVGVFVSALVTIPGVFLVFLVGSASLGALGFEALALAFLLLYVFPILFVLFKFWFAIEACVVGRYGPLGSLRVSWRITTSYREKFLRALVITAGSSGVFYLVGLVSGPGGSLVTPGPLLSTVATGLGELTSVVWYGVYTHLYVQGILDESGSRGLSARSD